MDNKVLDLAVNKKIADFASVIKAELNKKVKSNDYIAAKAEEYNRYDKIQTSLSDLNGSFEKQGE